MTTNNRVPKPSLVDIQAIEKKGFSDHDRRITNYKRWMSFYNRQFTPFAQPPDPSRYKVVIPGTAHALIDKAAAQLTTDNPIVTINPKNRSAKAQALADDQEKWGAAFLENISESASLPPFSDAGKRGLNGCYILKGPLFDFDLWGSTPKRSDYSSEDTFKSAESSYHVSKADKFPFIVKSVNPESVVWDHSNFLRPGWVIEKYEVTLSKFKKDFPEWKNPRGRPDGTRVMIVEYWSEDWRAIIADDELVLEIKEPDGTTHKGIVPNLYGYIPYEIGFGEWGMITDDPADAAVGILFTVEDALIEEARSRSIRSWTMQMYGIPNVISDDPEQTKAELEQGPGAVISDSANERGKGPRPMEMPEAPAWLAQYDAEIKTEITGNTFPEALAGFHQPGVNSGFQEAVNIGEGRMQFKGLVTSMARSATRILNRSAFVMEHLVGESMTVWATSNDGLRELITIDPKDFNGTYNFRVDMEPVDPTRDDRRTMLGLNLFAQGLLDPWTALEKFARIPNASEIINKIMLWRALQSPQIQEILTGVALDEFGIEEEMKHMREQGASSEAAPRAGGDFPVLGALNFDTPGIPGEAPPGGAESLDQGGRGSLPEESPQQSARRPGSGFGSQV